MSSYKVSLPNNEIRRFSLQDNTYTSLEQHLCSLLNIDSSQFFRSIYHLTYLDDEEEYITISNNEELLDALHLNKGTPLKIYLRRNPYQDDSKQQEQQQQEQQRENPKDQDQDQKEKDKPEEENPKQTQTQTPKDSSSFPQNQSQGNQQNNTSNTCSNICSFRSFCFNGPFHNRSFDQLPPHLSFLSEYLHFNPSSQPQPTPVEDQSQEDRQRLRHERQQRFLSEVQDMIFTIIITYSKLISLLLFGNRITLNEEKLKQQYDLLFSRRFNGFVNVISNFVCLLRNKTTSDHPNEQQHHRRSFVGKIFRVILVLYVVKNVFLPCLMVVAGAFVCFVGVIWSSWVLLPVLFFCSVFCF